MWGKRWRSLATKRKHGHKNDLVHFRGKEKMFSPRLHCGSHQQYRHVAFPLAYKPCMRHVYSAKMKPPTKHCFLLLFWIDFCIHFPLLRIWQRDLDVLWSSSFLFFTSSAVVGFLLLVPVLKCGLLLCSDSRVCRSFLLLSWASFVAIVSIILVAFLLVVF